MDDKHELDARIAELKARTEMWQAITKVVVQAGVALADAVAEQKATKRR